MSDEIKKYINEKIEQGEKDIAEKVKEQNEFFNGEDEYKELLFPFKRLNDRRKTGCSLKRIKKDLKI